MPLYRKLLELVRKKEYFVITTNVDAQFRKAGFDQHRLFEVQGDYGQMQCAVACHDTLYDNRPIVEAINANAENLTVDSRFVPCCPVCCGRMDVHVRINRHFVEDRRWHDMMECYSSFVERYGYSRLVLLELGVGFNTPSIIRLPFERMTRANSEATLVRLNADFPQASSDAAVTVYYNDGEITLAEVEGAASATVTPDVISDRRGTELNTYTIVKIGTQYWMAENLRATKFTDGTAIEAISESGTDAWKANTTGAYLTDADADWVKMAGYLYNGYCVTSDHGIAPEGWAVPTKAELTKLRTAGGTAAKNFKSSDPGTWAVGNTGTNINGFTAIANGYYSTATNLTGMQTEAYYWSSTTFSDWLTRQTGLETLRINGTATNVAVSNESGHALPFGHSIRCIRK